MSRNIDKLSAEALAPYLPIKNGRRNKYAIEISILVMILSVVAAWWLVGTGSFSESTAVAINYSVLIGDLVFIFGLGRRMLKECPECNRSVWGWLTEFDNRNLRGYGLCCTLRPDGKIEYGIEDDFSDTQEGFSVLVNLATKQCEIQRCWGEKTCGWKISLRALVLEPSPGYVVFELRDRKGGCVPLRDAFALGLLVRQIDSRKTFDSCGTMDEDHTVERIVRDLVIDSRISNEVAHKRNCERLALIAIILETERRIYASRRFGSSKEGAAIRKWLRRRFAACLIGENLHGITPDEGERLWKALTPVERYELVLQTGRDIGLNYMSDPSLDQLASDCWPRSYLQMLEILNHDLYPGLTSEIHRRLAEKIRREESLSS